MSSSTRATPSNTHTPLLLLPPSQLLRCHLPSCFLSSSSSPTPASSPPTHSPISSHDGLLEPRPEGKPKHSRSFSYLVLLKHTLTPVSSHPRLVSYSTVEEDNDSCGFDALDLDGMYVSACPGGQGLPQKDSEGKHGKKSDHRLELKTKLALWFIGRASRSTEEQGKPWI